MMDIYSESEPEVAQASSKPSATPTAEPKLPVPKSSYERSPDVQRWLQEQALEDGGTKGEFNPTFLAGSRDRLWILSSLTHFYQEDLITDVLHVVKSGKEATVYCCAADPATGTDYLAAKVYRPRMFRNLSNDAVYRHSRAQHDQDGHVVRDDRRRKGNKKNTRNRATEVTSWITYEFQTQQKLHAAGADVPRALSQIGNAVLMEYVGVVDEPAPLLREVRIPREEAQPLWDCLWHNIELFLANDCVHGDLSAYNILYWQGHVTIIDFAQAVDPRYNQEVYELLARDIERVYRYFAPYGVVADPGALTAELWTRYMLGEL
ncbi:MAG: hypothetical protein H0X37_14565 [Herpetosiphonaceae bacterium]|nr:hypothetical protein [Herpetosiphonaceae bacterium]